MKNVRLPIDLVVAVEEYQAREKYANFTQALERLLRAGAKAEGLK